MKTDNLEILGFTYTVDHYNDGICGNIWEVFAVPDEGLSIDPSVLVKEVKNFETSETLGVFFPEEGPVTYKGLHESDYDADEDASFETRKLAEKRGLKDFGETASIYS